MRSMEELFYKPADDLLKKEPSFRSEEQTQENMAAGMAPDEARREAILAFGGAAQVSEECREVSSWQWLESVAQDVRFGLRTLRKDRTYTFLAIVALALGLG